MFRLNYNAAYLSSKAIPAMPDKDITLTVRGFSAPQTAAAQIKLIKQRLMNPFRPNRFILVPSLSLIVVN
jgi:hypothetical protein